MTRKKKGRYWYGTDLADLQDEIVRYSQAEAEASRFATARCECGGDTFRLASDEEAGAARRTCVACATEVLMGDSDEYVADATLEEHVCVCDGDAFAITTGVGLYEGSDDVRWVYLGCWCRKCQLIGVFADWSCESGEAGVFLGKC